MGRLATAATTADPDAAKRRGRGSPVLSSLRRRRGCWLSSYRTSGLRFGTACRTFFCIVLAASLASATGCEGKSASTSAQALRTCVDRWNQANMLHWGPAFVNVSVRRLGATELAAVGLRDPARARCVVSVAFEFRRPRTGCGEVDVVARGKPGWCVDGSGTFDCAINPFGAYNCPLIHEPLGPPLRNKNATTDKPGVLKLDVPLKGTRATPPLAWHRYPHRDGFIEPWTQAGDLRRGLRLADKGHGPCFLGSEETHSKSGAVTCRNPAPGFAIVGPCFPSRRDWRRGDLAACANSPGDMTFGRWTISRHL